MAQCMPNRIPRATVPNSHPALRKSEDTAITNAALGGHGAELVVTVRIRTDRAQRTIRKCLTTSHSAYLP